MDVGKTLHKLRKNVAGFDFGKSLFIENLVEQFATRDVVEHQVVVVVISQRFDEVYLGRGDFR